MKKLFILIFTLFTITSYSQDEPFYRGVDPASFVQRAVLDLPVGFVLESWSTFHDQPIAILQHPTRSNFMAVAERKGLIWLYELKNGVWVIFPNPIIDIQNQVTKFFERGIQNIVMDSHHIYVYYTVEESYLFFGDVPENTATINRVSRWEISWSQNRTVGGEQIKIGVNPADGIPSLAGNHQGGGMAFGDNGFLYISTGDGANVPFADKAVEFGIIDEEYKNLSGNYRSQVLSQGNGKILKIQGWTGKGVSSNPYYSGSTPYSFKSRLFDYGYRNPFRITYSDSIYVADVGDASREEITIAKSDGNAGWGKYEGFDELNFSSTISNPDTGQPFEINYTNPPLLDYGHNSNAETRLLNPNDFSSPFIDGNSIAGNSLTGGVVLKEGFGNYTGGYIFSDYTRGWLNIAMNGFDFTINFASEGTVNSAVDITQLSDGSVLVVKLFGGIDRISFDGNLSTPDHEFNYDLATVKYFTMLGVELKDISNAASGIYIVEYYYNNQYKRKIIPKL